MMGPKIYRSVAIIRKLIAQKTNRLQDLLQDRVRCLNGELDGLEAEFSLETEKDEKELQKLKQNKTNTIELFNEGDKQLARIEDKIEQLQQRLDSRKLRLEWDDTNLTQQLTTIGSIVRMQQDTSVYEWLESDPAEENFRIEYELIDEEFLEQVAGGESKAETPPPETSSQRNWDESVVKNSPFEPSEYLVPWKNAPRSPGARGPPPPIPIPVPVTRASKKSHTISGAIPLMKAWRSKSFGENGTESASKREETDLYCKVPDGELGLGALRKKSNSLGGKPNLLGAKNQLGYKATEKCRIGFGPGQILKPKNIAISDKSGCIFVAEKGNNRVQVFAGTGDPMYSFSRKSGGAGHAMVKPYGICVLDETVFVSVSLFSCIQVYKVNGEFLMEKGNEGKGEGQFVFPTGLNTDGSSRIYACDYGNNRVQVFSKDLHFKQLIGVGSLLNPTDVAVDREGDLFIVDRSTTIVHQFSNKGAYKRKLIKIAMFPILSNPQYIAISPMGNLVLSDLLTNSINVFSMEGQLRWTIGGPRDKGVFGEPRGVAFDRSGNLVVACHKEIGCLQIIEMNI